MLEKKLGISLPKKGPLALAGKLTGTPDRFYSHRSGLTEEGVELLRHSLSQYEQVQSGMTVSDVFNVATAGNIASLCHSLFNYLPESCPECGHGEVVISAAGKVVCGACSASVRPLPGDEADERHVQQFLARQSVRAA